MTWRNGRQLSTVANGGKTYSYEYDANGLRTRRTNSDGGYTLYYIVDGLTVGEQQYTASGSIRRTMKYLLDENNSPVGISIHYPSYSDGIWDNYYFAKNLQGDVTAIYNASGALQARYTYDPYGNITSVTNASGAAIAPTAAHIANYNPFRYRGYLYDADTGFYYLKTRYYDPELGRFINADSFASTGQGILGYNMFAYCNNNPIIFKDSQGGIPNFAIDVSDAEENPMRAGYGSQKYPNYDSSGKGKSKRTSCSYNYDTRWSGYAPQNSNSVFIGGYAPHNFDSVITEVFKNHIEINGVIIYGTYEPVNEYTVYLIYKNAVIRMDITVKSPYTYREEGSDFAVAMKQTLEGMCGYAMTIGGLPGNCGKLAPWLMQIY